MIIERGIALRKENIDAKSNFSKLRKIRSKIDETLNEIDISINVQEAEARRRAEELKIQAEKEERERLNEINNAKAFLSEKLEAIFRKANKEIESDIEKERLEGFFEEISEKIQNMDNINRTMGLENLIASFQEDIDGVLAFEEKVRKENLEKLIATAKEELNANIDATDASIDEIQDGAILEQFKSDIANLRESLDGICDLDSLKLVQNNFGKIKSNLQLAIDEQNKKLEELRKIEELENVIESQRDENKQNELLYEGKLTLDDVIGGNKKAKDKAKALLKAFERYSKSGKIVPSKGILFYGVPGTGKTSLVKAIAAENNMEIFIINPSLVMGEDGPRKALEMFDTAKKASRVSGKFTILLVDEIDAIAQTRSSSTSNSVLVMLLNEIDKLSPADNVIIFATTNRREALDNAIIRSGRLDQSVEVGLPNAEDKEKILNIYLRNIKVEKDIDLRVYSDKMKGFCGADIKRTVDMAIINSMDRLEKERLSEIEISDSDIRAAIATVMDEKRN